REAKLTSIAPPPTTATTALPKVEPSGPGAGRILAWSAIGTGVAAAGVATVLRISSNSTRNTLEHDPLPPDQVAHDMSTVRTTATVSNLLFGAGAVLFTGGLIYILDR